jgi:hypothetical protein
MRTKSCRLAGALAGVTALALAAPAVDAAPSSASHAINFQTSSKTVVCGITAKVPGIQAGKTGDFAGLQCSAAGIGPRHPSEGDPFVQLGQGAAGRARIVEIGDDDLVSDAKPVTLKAGSTWTRYGISCAISTTSVNCVNGSGHGFTLAKGHFKTETKTVLIGASAPRPAI